MSDVKINNNIVRYIHKKDGTTWPIYDDELEWVLRNSGSNYTITIEERLYLASVLNAYDKLYKEKQHG